MTSYVIDASALINAVAGESRADLTLRGRLQTATCHAPHLIDAELGQTLRRLVRAGRLTNADATGALASGERFVGSRHAATGDLARAAWSLRDNVSFYDALYASLAVQLDLPLLTADEKLVNAPGLPCEVELV